MALIMNKHNEIERINVFKIQHKNKNLPDSTCGAVVKTKCKITNKCLSPF